MKIIHTSDTHFHHLDESNEAVMKRVKALEDYPDHIKLVTGDVTDDGRDDQRAKAEILLGLGRVLVGPGNHDYGTLGSGYDLTRAKAFDVFAKKFMTGPFFYKKPVVSILDNVAFIGLNTCLKTKDPFDFACGEVGKAQLGALNKVIDDLGDIVKIVYMHHHPFIHSDPHMKLIDADALLRVLFKRIDILAFGHLHEAGRWKDRVGIPLIIAAESLYDSNWCWELEVVGKEVRLDKIFLEGCNEAESHLAFRESPCL